MSNVQGGSGGGGEGGGGNGGGGEGGGGEGGGGGDGGGIVGGGAHKALSPPMRTCRLGSQNSGPLMTPLLTTAKVPSR